MQTDSCYCRLVHSFMVVVNLGRALSETAGQKQRNAIKSWDCSFSLVKGFTHCAKIRVSHLFALAPFNSHSPSLDLFLIPWLTVRLFMSLSHFLLSLPSSASDNWSNEWSPPCEPHAHAKLIYAGEDGARARNEWGVSAEVNELKHVTPDWACCHRQVVCLCSVSYWKKWRGEIHLRASDWKMCTLPFPRIFFFYNFQLTQGSSVTTFQEKAVHNFMTQTVLSFVRWSDSIITFPFFICIVLV